LTPLIDFCLVYVKGNETNLPEYLMPVLTLLSLLFLCTDNTGIQRGHDITEMIIEHPTGLGVVP
jgi:hypothetical protein